MKILKKKLFWNALLFAAGLAMLPVAWRRGDSALLGCAGGLMAIALLRLVQYARISRDEQLIRKHEMRQQDERYLMLAEKSGRLTFVLSVLVELAAALALWLTDRADVARMLMLWAALQSFAYVCILYGMTRRY